MQKSIAQRVSIVTVVCSEVQRDHVRGTLLGKVEMKYGANVFLFGCTIHTEYMGIAIELSKQMQLGVTGT